MNTTRPLPETQPIIEPPVDFGAKSSSAPLNPLPAQLLPPPPGFIDLLAQIALRAAKTPHPTPKDKAA